MKVKPFHLREKYSLEFIAIKLLFKRAFESPSASPRACCDAYLYKRQGFLACEDGSKCMEMARSWMYSAVLNPPEGTEKKNQ